MTAEQIVLVDDAGRPIGIKSKALIHGANTPLHLGFSCYAFDDRGRLLLTQRSRSKLTWPGYWSNSFCGHPGPGEALSAAVRRRAAFELGLMLDDIDVILPDFRYRAIEGGIVENEICPVTVARLTSDAPQPNPAEVDGWRWVAWDDIGALFDASSQPISPWFAAQFELLARRGWSPAALG